MGFEEIMLVGERMTEATISKAHHHMDRSLCSYLHGHIG